MGDGGGRRSECGVRVRTLYKAARAAQACCNMLAEEALNCSKAGECIFQALCLESTTG